MNQSVNSQSRKNSARSNHSHHFGSRSIFLQQRQAQRYGPQRENQRWWTAAKR